MLQINNPIKAFVQNLWPKYTQMPSQNGKFPFFSVNRKKIRNRNPNKFTEMVFGRRKITAYWN